MARASLGMEDRRKWPVLYQDCIFTTSYNPKGGRKGPGHIFSSRYTIEILQDGMSVRALLASKCWHLLKVFILDIPFLERALVKVSSLLPAPSDHLPIFGSRTKLHIEIFGDILWLRSPSFFSYHGETLHPSLSYRWLSTSKDCHISICWTFYNVPREWTEAKASSQHWTIASDGKLQGEKTCYGSASQRTKHEKSGMWKRANQYMAGYIYWLMVDYDSQEA